MTNEAENIFAQGIAADGFGEQSETVNAADLVTPEANGASAQTDAQESAPVQKAERTYTNADVEKIVKQRLAKQKNAYSLGKELIDEYMRTNNVKDEAEALSKIRDERIKTKAAAYKNDPEKAFEELLRNREQPREPEEETQTSEAKAERIYAEITKEIQDGRVPQGFDLAGYLKDRDRARDFLDLRDALGIERACDIAMRMSAPVKTQTERNRDLPQPIGTNNSYNPQQIDFGAMTTEQFREFEKKMKQAANSGKRVQF